jgi:hypothetical protein
MRSAALVTDSPKPSIALQGRRNVGPRCRRGRQRQQRRLASDPLRDGRGCSTSVPYGVRGLLSMSGRETGHNREFVFGVRLMAIDRSDQAALGAWPTILPEMSHLEVRVSPLSMHCRLRSKFPRLHPDLRTSGSAARQFCSYTSPPSLESAQWSGPR